MKKYILSRFEKMGTDADVSVWEPLPFLFQIYNTKWWLSRSGEEEVLRCQCKAIIFKWMPGRQGYGVSYKEVRRPGLRVKES